MLQKHLEIDPLFKKDIYHLGIKQGLKLYQEVSNNNILSLSQKLS